MEFEAFSSSYSDASPPYSDSASTPRTPSPQSPPSTGLLPPINFKHQPIESLPAIFHDASPDHFLHPDSQMIQSESVWSSHQQYPVYPRGGSLLQDLYDHDAAPEPFQSDVYLIDDQAHYNEWQQQQQQQQHHQHHHLQLRHAAGDHAVLRRATFPYVRHDQVANYSQHPSQFYDQYPSMYNEHLPVPTDPSERHLSHPSHDPQAIKLEDTPLIVPSQVGYSAHPLHPHHPASYLSPATGGAVPIQHTDDAASKETQYLRRRCFNCHTTEPPSWRRSTLNPGKIVCNKCGLYERTHLRPRPLRFDELRAGGKTRKAAGGAPGDKKGSKVPAASSAATASTGSPQVKKEPREFGPIRRGSVSSNASSGGGASDWDDNVSVYSSQPPTPGSTSGQSSAFPSPAVGTYPIPRTSESPPADAGTGVQGPIRLPNAPFRDIASFQQQQPQQSHPTPRKAATTPGYFSPPTAFQGHMQSPKTQVLSPPITSSPLLAAEVPAPSS
ncbi:hypothetical protein ID866_3137 [Astraeus odoratus]|nr:hypothetical protein ID866_3137 [Astraeus odoratus]